MDESIEVSDKSLHPAAWIDKYGDYLYRYTFSRLRDGDAAEEVVQETFVAALRHVNQYEAKGSERAWLLGILKRKIIDLIRARNRTTSLAVEDSNDPSEALSTRRLGIMPRTSSRTPWHRKQSCPTKPASALGEYCSRSQVRLQRTDQPPRDTLPACRC